MVDSRSFDSLRDTFGRRDFILLIVIASSLVLIIAGLLVWVIPGVSVIGKLVVNLAQTTASLTGLVLLVLNGTTIKTGYRNFLIASVLVVVSAILLIILHLPGGHQLLLLGCIILELIYTVRFITRSPTGILEWLKYTWICSWCVIGVFVQFRKLAPSYAVIPPIVFWITILLFVLIRLKIVDERKGDY
jgi:hypothetical protein